MRVLQIARQAFHGLVSTVTKCCLPNVVYWEVLSTTKLVGNVHRALLSNVWAWAAAHWPINASEYRAVWISAIGDQWRSVDIGQCETKLLDLKQNTSDCNAQHVEHRLLNLISWYDRLDSISQISNSLKSNFSAGLSKSFESFCCSKHSNKHTVYHWIVSYKSFSQWS